MADAEFKAQGNDAFKAGEFRKAEELYGQGIEAAPQNHVLYANRAASLLAQEKYEEAKSDCEKCLAIEPTFYKATLRLATALKELGEVKQAVVVLGVGIARAAPGSDAANSKKAKKTVGEKEMRRMERDFKALLTAAAGSNGKASSLATMQGGGSAVNNEEFRELSDRFGKAKHELGRCNAQIQEKDHEIKREALCLKQLENLEETGKEMSAYEAVGRMFIKKPALTIKAQKEDATEEMVAELTALKKKQEYFQRELKEVQANIQEVIGKGPRG